MRDAVSTLDRRFAVWVVQNFSAGLSDKDRDVLQRLSEAASFAVSLKHTCLDLSVCMQLGEPLFKTLLEDITAADVQRVVTDRVKPLVASADGKRVWLQKYHAFETGLAAMLRSRVVQAGVVSAEQKAMLQQLFNESSAEHRVAAEKALTHNVAIITGGPGTGKTWTVARLLVLLLAGGKPCSVELAAPTGKAGARMKEALDAAFNDEAMKDYRNLQEKLPQKASTLDGLLKINNRISPKPRVNRSQPLACDVLIVDEASMISSPTMYRLLDALASHTRLILLGDQDQLASVEAGSVIGDICTAGGETEHMIARITRSRRFGEDSEIGILARSLNNGKAQFAARHEQVRSHLLANANAWDPSWLEMAAEGYSWIATAVKQKVTAEEILKQQTQFQLLCALREGPFGVKGINRMVAEKLGHKPDSWYAGQPVMITQNDHDRKLYNGDVGMVLECDGSLKACFIVNGAVKAISKAQMPAYETCYAITVHKSQGSEYDRVMIVLPADLAQVEANPVLTRELVYTAVTRAKTAIDLWAGEGVLEKAAVKTTQRMSGLKDLLGDAQ